MTSFQEPFFSIVILLARFLLSAVFLVSGIHKAGWYSRASEEFRGSSVPLVSLVLPATIALHLVGSICIICGIFVTEAALSLAVFILAATLWVHRFWERSGDERLALSRIALANLGIVGGLILLAATGPGKYVLI